MTKQRERNGLIVDGKKIAESDRKLFSDLSAQYGCHIQFVGPAAYETLSTTIRLGGSIGVHERPTGNGHNFGFGPLIKNNLLKFDAKTKSYTITEEGRTYVETVREKILPKLKMTEA